MADEESCSDCRIEIIETIWAEILLNWLNNCVIGDEKPLDINSLEYIVNKYKDDVCCDDFDKALLASNLDGFIKYKFPILRISILDEGNQKLYILTSVLLYYCCTNTKGQVYADICTNISETEQIMIIKFCEILSTMEVTINNVKAAIEGAYTSIHQEKVNLEQKLNETDSDLTESDILVDSLSKLKSNTIQAKIQFKSSITVLPSVVDETSRSLDFSDDSRLNAYLMMNQAVCSEKDMLREDTVKESSEEFYQGKSTINPSIYGQSHQIEDQSSDFKDSSSQFCQPDCACTRCSPTGPCCGDPGCTRDMCDDKKSSIFKRIFTKMTWNKNGVKDRSNRHNWVYYTIIGSILLLALIIFLSTMPLWLKKDNLRVSNAEKRIERRQDILLVHWIWQCKNNLCHRVTNPAMNISTYNSQSQCTLLCTGPQLWPYPIGYTYFSKTIVTLSTKKMEYKFKSVPSEEVRQYLAEAFKLFVKDLAKMERNNSMFHQKQDLSVMRMIVQIDIEGDSDARLRLNTDESYILRIDLVNNDVFIKISSVSFCGTRHGLETLIQLILVDQSTGYLITLSNILINDNPTYKYRGLMIDTVHNYIPVVDLVRTIDAMSTCKLNTLHWRIDMTSFPIENNAVFQYGPCDKSMVYSKKDISYMVKRAGVRGIRILIEIAVPGIIGSPWAWINESTCPKNNLTSNPVSIQEIFNILQKMYSLVLEITKVDDIFHLGQNIFPPNNCYGMTDIDYFDKALEHLKMANKGFLPKLPIIWYEANIIRYFDETWPRFGVQYKDLTNPNLSKFKVIHSTKWDLSCEIRNQGCTKYRTWQQMYSWISWRNIEALTIEGGEAILWTDLVDSSNLDYHVWPRAATVAERLWSDIVANTSVDKSVYVRLDAHRSRMLRHGINVQPIWPAWCSFNPTTCLQNVH